MTQEKVKIDVPALLKYFDTTDSKWDASSLMGVFGEDLITGLLQRYLLQERHQAIEVLHKHGQPIHPKLGNTRSKQLDRWLIAEGRTTERSSQQLYLYQVEIKSWSATTLGGKPVSDKMNAESAGRANWERHFNRSTKCFKYIGVEKVLIRMLPPEERHIDDSRSELMETLKGHIAALKPRPIIAFWEPIVIDGQDVASPLVSKDNLCHTSQLIDAVHTARVETELYTAVEVFSASNYLRTLSGEDACSISLEMPIHRRRTAVMSRLLQVTGSSA